jgi:hypothetical protein
MNYPYPCSRCGTCCLIEVCPMGMDIYKLTSKEGRCPALTFNNTFAQCGALQICRDKGIPESDIKNLFGIGKGCCILAKVFGEGKSYDIASMPPYTKTLVARQLMLKEGITIKIKGGLSQ